MLLTGNATSNNSILGNLTLNGGHFKPSHCEARAAVAVIIPYRDREEHLKTFLDYIHPFLQKQVIEYVIYVVELVSYRQSKTITVIERSALTIIVLIKVSDNFYLETITNSLQQKDNIIRMPYIFA